MKSIRYDAELQPEFVQDEPGLEHEPVENETLDPEILMALGEASDDKPKFGPNINNNLAQRWTPLLRKGLSKESKEKLLKEYLIPENCQLLQAPKLNEEITAAIAEPTKNRDKKLESFQQQLGLGLTAINMGLSELLTGGNKIMSIKHISDGCRLLLDLHHLETKARKNMVTPGLTKSFLNIIQECERDETIFGNDLAEKIKASKAIERQGLQIKKPYSNPKNTPSSTSFSSAATRTNQGNWQGGPLRYPTSSYPTSSYPTSSYPTRGGGRGGPRKYPTQGAARRPAAQPPTRAAGQSKSRAVARR